MDFRSTLVDLRHLTLQVALKCEFYLSMSNYYLLSASPIKSIFSSESSCSCSPSATAYYFYSTRRSNLWIHRAFKGLFRSASPLAAPRIALHKGLKYTFSLGATTCERAAPSFYCAIINQGAQSPPTFDVRCNPGLNILHIVLGVVPCSSPFADRSWKFGHMWRRIRVASPQKCWQRLRDSGSAGFFGLDRECN